MDDSNKVKHRRKHLLRYHHLGAFTSPMWQTAKLVSRTYLSPVTSIFSFMHNYSQLYFKNQKQINRPSKFLYYLNQQRCQLKYFQKLVPIRTCRLQKHQSFTTTVHRLQQMNKQIKQHATISSVPTVPLSFIDIARGKGSTQRVFLIQVILLVLQCVSYSIEHLKSDVLYVFCFQFFGQLQYGYFKSIVCLITSRKHIEQVCIR